MALISDAELRRRLQELGMLVGPITDTTRCTYQRALRKRCAEEATGATSKKPRLAMAHPSPTPAAKPTRPRPRRPHSSAELSRLQPRPSPKPPLQFKPVPPLQPAPEKHGPVSVKLEDRPVHPSPPSPPPPSYFKQNLDFSPRPKPQPQRTPLPSPSPPSPSVSPPPLSPTPPSPKSPGSSGGLLSVMTNWIGAGVKKIAHQLQPLATPRAALGRHRSQRQSPNSSPRRRASYESIPIDEVDLWEANPGPSGFAGSPSRPRVPSPSRAPAAPSQKATPSSYDWELLPSDVEVCLKADGAYWRLGKGGFGEVFKGIKDGLDEVAIKVIQIQSSGLVAITQFKQEIDMISKLRHRHIIQFYGACIQPNSLYMVTELMQTDLFSALRKDPRYLWTGLYGKGVLEGIASGLHYLHSRRPPVVHRDIKSPNILLMDGLAKIADVGIARTKAASDMTAQRGFTAAWAAPEVIYRKRATEKIDIWGLGIVLWEVVSGNLPRPGHLSLPGWAPVPLQQLYTQCVEQEADKRPGAVEVVQRLKKMT